MSQIYITNIYLFVILSFEILKNIMEIIDNKLNILHKIIDTN